MVRTCRKRGGAEVEEMEGGEEGEMGRGSEGAREGERGGEREGGREEQIRSMYRAHLTFLLGFAVSAPFFGFLI